MADSQSTPFHKEDLRQAVGEPRRELLRQVPIPNALFEDRLKPQCLSVFTAMMRFYHMQELLSVGMIAGESGLSRSTVSRHLPALVENKWVTKSVDITKVGTVLETHYQVNPMKDGPGYVIENVITNSIERTQIDDVTVVKVYTRDGFKCVTCGSIENLTIDHITPIVRGGGNGKENLQTMCRPCNSAKRARVVA